MFTGDPAENLGGPFDVDRDDKIAKATFGDSFGDLSFGNVAATGVSEADVGNDLTVSGTFFPTGTFSGAEGNVDLFYVPEPSTIVLISLGLLSLIGVGWRRRA